MRTQLACQRRAGGENGQESSGYRESGPMIERGRRTLSIMLLAAAIACAIGEAAFAQSPPANATSPIPTTPIPTAMMPGVLRLRSEPTGAFVTLAGEHSWRGTTPFDLSRGLNGPYEVTAEMTGYERWHRSVILGQGENRELAIRLTPKTALKAGLRSALIPGWGQFYSERRGKGTLFLLATAISAGGLIWTHEDYQNKLDDLRSAKDAYFGETRLEELPALRARMVSLQHTADRAYDRRRIFLFTTGGLYAANLIDAVALFPSASRGTFASLSPWGEGGPRLSIGTSADSDLLVGLELGAKDGGAR